MTSRLLEMVRRPRCEHFLDYFPFTELQCMVPLSMFAHNILAFAHIPKTKKRDTFPTKPLIWQMKMKFPLICRFECKNMADICARFEQKSLQTFFRKMALTNGYMSSLETK